MKVSCLSILAVFAIAGADAEDEWRLHPSNRPFPKWPPDNELPSGKEVIRIGYLTSTEPLRALSQTSTGQALLNHYLGYLISGAMTLAVNEINNRTDLLPGHVIQFLYADTFGCEELSVQYTSRLLQVENVSAIIGPQDTCVTEASVAHSYNRLMISYYCAQHQVANGPKYRTFIRTRSSDTSAANSVVSLLNAYNWKKIALLHCQHDVDPTMQHCQSVYQATLKVLSEFNVSVTADKVFEGSFDGFPDEARAFESHYTEFGSNTLLKEFENIIEETYEIARIYVVIGKALDLVPLMMVMGRRNLLTGNYFVIGVDPVDPYNPTDPFHYIQGTVYNSIPPELYTYYQSVALIMKSAPINTLFDEFTDAVLKYNQMEPFRFRTNELMAVQPRLYVAALLYDAVYAYATAVNRTLPSDFRNGQNLASHLIGSTFTSKSGYLVKFDENGNVEGSYSLFYRGKERTKDPLTNKFGLYPVADFLVKGGFQLPVFTQKGRKNITFVLGKAPSDEPECGFHLEKCPQRHAVPIWQAAFGAVVGLLLLAAIIAVTVHRRKLYEQDLRSLIWRINYKDIKQDTRSPAGIRMNRLASLIRDSSSFAETNISSVTSSLFGMPSSHQSIQCATYKGLTVAIKRIRKNSIVITRAVQKELKLMRDVRHDNLVTFIGACVEPGNILIVLEYCSKGSLFDILQNPEVKLDSVFINSLINDIIKGMTFLHDSELHYHGNLKSSNCLVDSRWGLKLSGYGLHNFKAGQYPEQLTESQQYMRMLWTAPELLRKPQMNQALLDMQKADVYSFAVISYELCGRNGPFGDYHMEYTNAEIIKRVRDSSEIDLFRPKLAALSHFPKCVTECIRDCWSDNPEVRPDFRTIRYRLRPVQKGMKGNILDNVIAMMEKYTSNLESIVQERTEQLIEEKRKAEELLHQMLPRSVADQLKRGKEVEAESFDSVTIYFSDICGFTSLSSESTPLQIVTLLNDLYTVFDEIIGYYDVYKVETIGDAYMVVSGLPKKNGLNHAGEIASLSLHLLSALKHFTIRHRPHDTLKLRIGFHSGPCVAGVVGLKMPRYCLFGDTVNTASRLESTGQPLKIHCSRSTKLLLDKLGGYVTEERGLVEMKGKGQQLTYWLISEDPAVRQHRLLRTQSYASIPASSLPGSRTASGGGRDGSTGGDSGGSMFAILRRPSVATTTVALPPLQPPPLRSKAVGSGNRSMSKSPPSPPPPPAPSATDITELPSSLPTLASLKKLAKTLYQRTKRRLARVVRRARRRLPPDSSQKSAAVPAANDSIATAADSMSAPESAVAADFGASVAAKDNDGVARPSVASPSTVGSLGLVEASLNTAVTAPGILATLSEITESKSGICLQEQHSSALPVTSYTRITAFAKVEEPQLSRTVQQES